MLSIDIFHVGIGLLKVLGGAKQRTRDDLLTFYELVKADYQDTEFLRICKKYAKLNGVYFPSPGELAAFAATQDNIKREMDKDTQYEENAPYNDASRPKADFVTSQGKIRCTLRNIKILFHDRPDLVHLWKSLILENDQTQSPYYMPISKNLKARVKAAEAAGTLDG